MADFATSGGHWYALDGRPCYTVKGKNGIERPTTLRDARQLGLVPSVTGIIRMAAAPALEQWKRNQVLLSALTLPRMPSETEQAWLQRVEQDWQEQGRAAADRGTEIHAAIEKDYRGEIPDQAWWDWVKIARVAINDACGHGHEWLPERSFAHPLGYGGKVDMHSNAWVLDIKTKDGDLCDAKLYDEHHCQLAAYRHGLGVGGANCGILFVSRTQPTVRFMQCEEKDLRKGWQMFEALLAYWKAKTGHMVEAEKVAG